ncbi:unnamed protein product [Penicillium discolor]
MSSQDEPPVKRRESRSGTRKVSTLSVEQLERKRANDREAQRSIRQRTKEHIEQLEAQVSTLQSQIAEMRLQNERFDELVQHNAILENEVIRLKHQVASLTGRPEFASPDEPMAPFRSEWSLDEASSSALPGIPTTGALLPPHFTATSHTQRPSDLLASRQESHQHGWQQPYPPTRSPSLGAASDAEFPNLRLQQPVTFHVECRFRSSTNSRPSLPTLHSNIPATNASIATDGSGIRVSMGSTVMNNASSMHLGEFKDILSSVEAQRLASRGRDVEPSIQSQGM